MEKIKNKKSVSDIEKITNSLNIEVVKLIGNLKGNKEKVEIVMDKDVFFEWIEILKTTKTIKINSPISKK